jgi:opine dehydrogenase
MLEDTRLGLSFLVSVGKWLEQPTPIASGFLAIASAITGRDLYQEGRTFERFGLADFSKKQMQALLRDGL